ncbi:MAG: RidA family protein [candidate division Zixibacteria bacterium]|nr:RidA family protein [candidate division Zixibacteria bacterium]
MKEIIRTSDAPAAVGPYSQGVKIKCGTMIFCSGQIPLNPKDGKMVGNTAAEQTEQVLKNLQAILSAGGANLKDLVKTTIFLADMNDFAAVNEVYAKHFIENMPARAAVAVTCLPKNARVQIEAIAII